MKAKTRLSFFLLAVASLLAEQALFAASMEHGHVRARMRGWTDQSQLEGKEPEAEQTQAAAELEERVSYFEEPAVEAAEQPSLERQPASRPRKQGPGLGQRIGSQVKRGANLILIGGGKGRGPARSGYLAAGAPNPLRFSDVNPARARPPSPALPEFSFAPSGHMPYLVETALPEDAMNDHSMLSEIVIELEPHEVVSGKIDTHRVVQEEMVEHFELDEQRTTVLRPEEVLIFFETDTVNGSSGAVVPFSPATPTTTTIKSSATLKKE